MSFPRYLVVGLMKSEMTNSQVGGTGRTFRHKENSGNKRGRETSQMQKELDTQHGIDIKTM